ncbi:MAG: hypothetical protein NZ529_00130 [Cytophagaceae bacterium]|nr:hypothetical protein [Cytophagaceae bacterium]MDW8455172.1 hypothetical protein [Cytophagaceae bacterium]
MLADFQSGSLEGTIRDFTPHTRINLPPTSLQNHQQTPMLYIGWEPWPARPVPSYSGTPKR